MELILRLAELKISKQNIKEKTTFNQCLTKFLKDIQHVAKKYDLEIWRFSTFYTNDVHTVIDHYSAILKDIYDFNSSRRVKQNQNAFMCIEEFRVI